MKVLRADWLWTGAELLADGALCIDKSGQISAIGAYGDVRRQVPETATVTSLGQGLLMPGLVNGHSHAFQRSIRGHVQWRDAAHDSFWTWRQAMYAAANRLDAGGVYAVSRLCFIEMAEAGITHVGEFHYLHHDPKGQPYADPDELARQVIAAARDVGLRITLLRVVYGAGGIGQPLGPEQRRFRTDSPGAALDAVRRLSETDDTLVNIGLAPHSVRAVPQPWLAELASFDGVVHAHVAEQPAEVAACEAAFGMSPLQLLAEAGLVTDRFSAVHLTWPSPGDGQLMREAGATLCVCPSTELDLGDGLLPLELRQGVALSLGSDSHARIDLFAESRALEMHARALAHQRNVMSPTGVRHGLAERLLTAATRHGSRSLGLAGDGLAESQPADCCFVDLDRPAADGVPPLEAAVFVATPEWVSDVWVAGERIVTDGRAVARRSFGK
ncbi:MAG: formimidoylglutamate deiminase [Myxococcales bacterium]|nr:formimidoylglutamate deiminase [Myxococcales bacterium]